MIRSASSQSSAAKAPVKAFRYTASGLRIDLFDLQPEDLRIADVAAHLANIGRFGGATRDYSVAQHCVLGARFILESELLEQTGLVSQVEIQRIAYDFLMHDAHEAYLQDIISPIKRALVGDEYREHERVVDALLARRFGYRSTANQASGTAPVHTIDMRMLSTEEMFFFGQTSTENSPLPIRILPWGSTYAETCFLSLFRALKPEGVGL